MWNSRQSFYVQYHELRGIKKNLVGQSNMNDSGETLSLNLTLLSKLFNVDHVCLIPAQLAQYRQTRANLEP